MFNIEIIHPRQYDINYFRWIIFRIKQKGMEYLLIVCLKMWAVGTWKIWLYKKYYLFLYGLLFWFLNVWFLIWKTFSEKYKKLFSFEEMSFLGDKYKKLRSCLRSVLNYLLRKRPPGQTNILNENQSKFGFNFNINFKQLIFMSILISKSLGCLHLAEDYYIWLSFPR